MGEHACRRAAQRCDEARRTPTAALDGAHAGGEAGGVVYLVRGVGPQTARAPQGRRSLHHKGRRRWPRRRHWPLCAGPHGSSRSTKDYEQRVAAQVGRVSQVEERKSLDRLLSSSVQVNAICVLLFKRIRAHLSPQCYYISSILNI